ncbi:MAG: glycosyltransferase, partial [Gemmatimonadetes bacterium]|nr:glycosyltransferase [Gemmatimonadota bacterium]
MTRVCIVSRSLPPEYGGAEIAAYRYGERLAARGNPPLFVAPDGGEAYPDWVVPLNVPSVMKAVGARARLLRLAGSLWPVMWKRRREYDVVHIFNSAPLVNLLAVPISRALGKPVILESSLVGSDDPLALMKRKKGRRRRLFLANPLRYELYRRGSAFISKSPVLLRACREAPLPPEKMTLIP